MAIVNTLTGRNEDFKSLEKDIKERQNEFDQFMHMVIIEGLLGHLIELLWNVKLTVTKNNERALMI